MTHLRTALESSALPSDDGRSLGGFHLARYCDMNSSHVHQADADLVISQFKDGILACGVIAAYEHGWFIYVPEERDVLSVHLGCLGEEGFSDAYLDVIQKLHDDKIAYARFDSDSDINPRLPVFVW